MKFFFEAFLKNKLLILRNLRNIRSIFLFKKIILHFGFKNSIKNTKQVLSGCLVLGLLTFGKGLILQSKKSLMILKIRRGMVVSTKITLTKNNLYLFLNRFLLINYFKMGNSIFLNRKSIDKSTVTLRISDLYVFPEIERFFDFCDDLPFLTITLVSNEFSDNSFKKLLTFLIFIS